MSKRSEELFQALNGRGLVRVREEYVRDTVAPLLAQRYAGAVKLDLVLRCLADRESGEVREMSWEELHDLSRPSDWYRRELKLKRQWVGEGLRRLESLGLVKRTLRGGRSSTVRVLRDDGSGSSFDDPVESGEPYVSVLGTLVQHERLARWEGAQIAAFFAAMVAERYSRADPRTRLLSQDLRLGGGVWYRTVDWFADSEESRPASHVRLPFSPRTLRRGFRALRDEGLIIYKRIRCDPVTGERFSAEYGRNIYRNGFDDVRDPDRRMSAFGWGEPGDYPRSATRTVSYDSNVDVVPVAELAAD